MTDMTALNKSLLFLKATFPRGIAITLTSGLSHLALVTLGNLNPHHNSHQFSINLPMASLIHPFSLVAYKFTDDNVTNKTWLFLKGGQVWGSYPSSSWIAASG